MSKFYLENQETEMRWQFEVDVDKETMEDLIASDAWDNGPLSSHVDEFAFSRQGNGYLVFDVSDKRAKKIIKELKAWFEEQGCDTTSITLVEQYDPDEAEDEDEYVEGDDLEDVYEEMLNRGSDY